MKRKITTIKNKRLVEGGGENLLTKNEILVETKGDTITLKERDDSGKIKELSGSSSGGTNIDNEVLDEPLYYKFEWSEDITTDVGENMIKSLLYFLPKNSYVVLKGGYKDMPQIEVPFNAAFEFEVKSHIKIKITNKYVVGKNEDDYGVYWRKINVSEFLPLILETFSSSGLNIIEISKEEYYSDIEVKYEDIPIQQIQ